MGTETGFEVLKNIYVDLVESGKIEFRALTPVADILVKDGQVTGAVPVSYTHLDVYKRQEIYPERYGRRLFYPGCGPVQE